MKGLLTSNVTLKTPGEFYCNDVTWCPSPLGLLSLATTHREAAEGQKFTSSTPEAAGQGQGTGTLAFWRGPSPWFLGVSFLPWAFLAVGGAWELLGLRTPSRHMGSTSSYHHFGDWLFNTWVPGDTLISS